ncbi:50S ribosomal protein L18 [Candidatus Micrarchaeota archaeon]|nr:50S ribosomal protein L18 [Candidatus Micrarchaeota archaeon]
MSKATGPKYRVHFRRRREGLTDYRKRVALIKSGLPRLVIRKTNKQVIAQIIEFSPEGDRVIASATSKELSKHGWLPKRNSPTAYLTGYLCGKRGKKKGVKRVVLDIGLSRPSKGSIVFVGLKGVVDAGIESTFDESVVSEDRIRGLHIAEYAKRLKAENEELFRKRFSDYLNKNVDVVNLDKLFETVKEKITKDDA